MVQSAERRTTFAEANYTSGMTASRQGRLSQDIDKLKEAVNTRAWGMIEVQA